MKIKDKVIKLMLKNRRSHNGFYYTVPSPDTYPYQWLWDSCFHAIILTHFNVDDAKKELLSLVSKQFKNGMIPHMIYWEKFSKADFPIIEWGKKDTSTITQPPLLATSVLRIYQVDKDKKFLRKIYPHLKKFYKYLFQKRNPRKNNLIGILNPDESGEDNSPRFDKLLGLPPIHSLDINFEKRLELVAQLAKCNFEADECMRQFFWAKDVPFNVITIKGLEDLSKIAKEIDKNDDATEFLVGANLIKNAMRKLMFDDGIFYSTYGINYEKIKVITWAIFMPMFAKLYSFNEVKDLIGEYFLNKNHFLRPYLIPTVSKAEPSYDPSGPLRGTVKLLSTHLSWRGPVWMGVNWFIYNGLNNYGFFDLAKEVFKSSLNLLENAGFRELYNPETGEGMGAKNFSWGGLILDMQSLNEY